MRTSCNHLLDRLSIITTPGALERQAALMLSLHIQAATSRVAIYSSFPLHEQSDKDKIQNINKDGCQEDCALRVLGESLLN